jgi:hypothetical protein
MKQALTLIACALILCVGSWSPSEAGGMRPGWYAYSLLVYGNNGYERLAAGCLRWHYQERAWYDHCVGPRRKPVVAKY